MAELGHAIYVENLTAAIQIATAWGSKYDPSNPLLSIASMTKTRDAGAAAIDATQQSIVPYRNATNAAKIGFDRINPLARRVIPAMKGQGIIDPGAIDDVKFIIRKLTGRRATPAIKDDPNTTNVNEAEKSNSASQMSRTQRIENVENLSLQLGSYADYKPNESDLTAAGITAFAGELRALVDGVTNSFVPYSNNLSDRDDKLYNNPDSVVKVGNMFKAYVESKFTRDSDEWRQVEKLVFKNQSRNRN